MPWPECTAGAVEGNSGGERGGVAKDVQPSKDGRVLAGQLRVLPAFREA